jgi:hypothetical protein
MKIGIKVLYAINYSKPATQHKKKVFGYLLFVLNMNDKLIFK